MVESENKTARVFKTAWFAKTAKKSGIKDDELCEAIGEAIKGQCDDLGGGVYKKRLSKNLHRSILLSKSATRWIYAYLFAKKDRDNIDDDELVAFKKLAKAYGELTEQQLKKLIDNKDLLEICDADEEKV